MNVQSAAGSANNSRRSLEDRWPHLTMEHLLLLWERHRPPFLRLERPEEELKIFKVPFLVWLERKGILEFDGGSVSARERIKLARIAMASSAPSQAVEVVLSLGADSSRIVKSARTSSDAIVRLSADATLEAIQRLIPRATFRTVAAYSVKSDHSELGEAALVFAEHVGTGSNEKYLGACSVRGFAAEGAARAALDATNRYVESVLLRPTR